MYFSLFPLSLIHITKQKNKFTKERFKFPSMGNNLSTSWIRQGKHNTLDSGYDAENVFTQSPGEHLSWCSMDLSEQKKKSRDHQTNFSFLWQWLFLVILVYPFVVQSKLCLHLNHAANHISDLVNMTKCVLNMKLRSQVLVCCPPLS